MGEVIEETHCHPLGLRHECRSCGGGGGVVLLVVVSWFSFFSSLYPQSMQQPVTLQLTWLSFWNTCTCFF